jgi:hypothetical protein
VKTIKQIILIDIVIGFIIMNKAHKN